MAGLGCNRKLWLQLWRPELAAEPQGMDRLIMEQGTLFGELAHQLFPQAVLIDIDIRNLAQAEADTLAAIEGGAEAVLEATFRYGQYRVLSDVVQRLGDGSWHLIEVKSSTRTKPEHIPDLAFQRHVMEASGYQVSRCSVVHANTSGQWPDLDSYFSSTDVTDEVAGYLPNVVPSLSGFSPLLEQNAPCPELALSKTCLDCEFRAHCWQGIDKPTIYEVIDARKIADLEAGGVLYVDDIPAVR